MTHSSTKYSYNYLHFTNPSHKYRNESPSSLLKLRNNTEHDYVSTEVHLSSIAYKRTEMPHYQNSDLRLSFSR